MGISPTRITWEILYHLPFSHLNNLCWEEKIVSNEVPWLSWLEFRLSHSVYEKKVGTTNPDGSFLISKPS